MMRDRSDIDAIRSRLSDPREIVRTLGLADGAKPQGRGVLIRCPAHDDRTPSCSVRVGPDRTIQVKCHAAGCDLAGDVLRLIAAVHRLDSVRDFAEVKRRAAELARLDLDALPVTTAPPRPVRETPPRTFPPVDQVHALWHACTPCGADPDVAAWLRSRGIEPAIVDRFGLVRALPFGAECPPWASYRGAAPAAQPWSEIGYRAIFPMYDANGSIRSVRARYMGPERDDSPKALPPSGYATKGLVLGNPLAAMMLQIGAWRASGKRDALEHGGAGWPAWAERRVLICEGEPDFLSWAARFAEPSTLAILGLAGSGQWTDTIASRIPDGATIILRTDEDDAGDTYAADIGVLLRSRCDVRESNPVARAERRRTRPERDRATREARRAEQVQIPEVR